MTYYIYTIGDAALLKYVFDGIAATFGGNSPLGSIIRIVALLGIAIMFIRALWMGGKGLSLGPVFGAIIIFWITVIPKTTVYIQDVYTGQVRPIDNVPLGVAFVGHISSKIGYSITKMFDQAFSLPQTGTGITENGYVSALEVMSNVQRYTSDRMLYASANKKGGGNYTGTVQNYIRDCALVAVDRGHLSIDEIMAPTDISKNVFEVLRWDSELYSTTYTDGGQQKEGTCKEVYAFITSKRPEFEGALMEVLGNKLLSKQEITAGGVSGQVKSKIADSLRRLNKASINVADYFAANYMYPIFVRAAQDKHITEHQYVAANMIAQSIHDRNIQWAAEHSMFNDTFRPMYSFIEAMIYGVTPLMAVLIMLGPMGMSLAAKQFMGLVWLQMWMPLLSIANLYIYLAASNKMSALAATVKADLNSFQGLLNASQIVDTYVAVGGYMASSAPVLAGFLVTGSAVALTGVASRIQGGDHVNEKMMSPDSTSTPPIMARESPITASALGGVHSTGSAGEIGSLTLSTGRTDGLSSTQSAMQEAAAQYSRNVADTASSLYSHSGGVRALDSISKQNSSGHSQVASFMSQALQRVGGGHNFSAEERAMLSSILLGSLSKKMGGGKAGSKLPQLGDSGAIDGVDPGAGGALGDDGDPSNEKAKGAKGAKGKGGIGKLGGLAAAALPTPAVSGSTVSNSSLGTGSAFTKAAERMMALAKDSGIQAQFQKAVMTDTQNGVEDNWEKALSSSNSSSLEASRSEALRASKAYQETAEGSRSATSGRTLEGASLLNKIGGSMGAVIAGMSPGVKHAFQELSASNSAFGRNDDGSNKFNLSDQQRSAWAALEAYRGAGQTSALSSILSSSSFGDQGFGVRVTGDPNSNSGLVSKAPNPDDTQITSAANNAGLWDRGGETSKEASVLPGGYEGAKAAAEQKISAGKQGHQANFEKGKQVGTAFAAGVENNLNARQAMDAEDAMRHGGASGVGLRLAAATDKAIASAGELWDGFTGWFSSSDGKAGPAMEDAMSNLYQSTYDAQYHAEKAGGASDAYASEVARRVSQAAVISAANATGDPGAITAAKAFVNDDLGSYAQELENRLSGTGLSAADKDLYIDKAQSGVMSTIGSVVGMDPGGSMSFEDYKSSFYDPNMNEGSGGYIMSDEAIQLRYDNISNNAQNGVAGISGLAAISSHNEAYGIHENSGYGAGEGPVKDDSNGKSDDAVVNIRP